MVREAEHPGCPLEAVHRRLEDLHRQWHAASDAYFDPEAFRSTIQTAIQTARTVSFILQSNKHVFPDFDAWYGPWQEKMKADALMRWMVEARNKIEKQGDLEAHSIVRAEIIASYLSDEVPRIEVPAALFDAPIQLVKGLPQDALGDHIRQHGIIRIQRRWVENSLPEYELLDAVAIAYGRLSALLGDAHVVLGMETPETTNTKTGEVYSGDLREGRLPCMIGHGELRSLDVQLADGRPVQLVNMSQEFDRKKAEKTAARYGTNPNDVFKGDTVEEIFKSLYLNARTIFLKDGYHITVIVFLQGGKPVHLAQIALGEHGQKYLMMRELANELTRRGADAVVMIGESWMAQYDAKEHYRRVAEAPDRKEALTATLVQKQGDSIQLTSMIGRDGGVVTLSEVVEMRNAAQFMFAPIYEAWGREIPKEWTEKFLRDD